MKVFCPKCGEKAKLKRRKSPQGDVSCSWICAKCNVRILIQEVANTVYFLVMHIPTDVIKKVTAKKLI